MSDAGIGRLISSLSVRCVETIRPLADQAGLVIEADDRLAEGSTGEAALALAEELRTIGAPVALCSHGDVIPELLWKLQANGTVFQDPPTWPKGSVWRVDSNGAHWAAAQLVLPS